MYFDTFVLCYFRKCSICRMQNLICSSLISQLMEYSYLLDMADETDDPYMRLVYACECYFIVSFSHIRTHTQKHICAYIAWNMTLQMIFAASFFISVYYAYQRTWKPFNPILGETYEMANHGGMSFIAEQVRLTLCLFLFQFFK